MTNLDRLVALALVSFSLMCLAIAAACIEWIRLPVDDGEDPRPTLSGSYR